MNFIQRTISNIFYLILILGSIACSNEYEIFVSPLGNDDAVGTIDEPIKSLQYAAELASKKATKIPVTIHLSGGIYHLADPVKLGVSEGGTKDSPIIWKANPSEEPIISGGISIKNWNIENNGMWSATLPNNFNGNFRSFYINNRRAERARHPDNNYLRVEKTGYDKRTNFFFRKNDIPELFDISGLELVFLHDWSITRIDVKSIDWKRNHLSTVDSIGARLPFFSIDNWEEHPRFYLENSLKFCDSPGEWYCDFETRKIYYYPLPSEDITQSEGIIPVATKLLTIDGQEEKYVNYITFDGITFAHTSWALPENGYCGIQACMFTNRSSSKNTWDKIPAAIELRSAKNIKFINCTIKHLGGSGIWVGSKNQNCEISESHIYDISGNGINIGEGRTRLVSGMPWWKTVPWEVAKNNKVNNTLIESCGKQFYGAVGIWAGLVSQITFAKNEIRELPYTGVSIGWMWDTTSTPCRENIISSNHIHNVMKILSDGGGIYSLGQQPGSKIVNNLIHDVNVNAGRAESNGMFLDEGTKDLIVENNIVYNIAKSPLRFHKAFKNLVQNNVFVCDEGIPPIQYNRTKKEDIRKIGNKILSKASQEDMKILDSIINKIIVKREKEVQYDL